MAYWDGFRPLVAGGADPFSGLYAQRMGIDQANLSTETGNAARLAVAQQAQTNWLAQAAALRSQAEQRNVNLQLAQDEADRRSVERAQDIALNKTMWQERLAEERARTEGMAKRQQLAFDVQQKQAEQAIDVHGQAAAANYLRSKLNADAAQKALEDLDAEIESKTAQYGKAKGVEAINLGNDLKELKKRRPVAATAAQRAEAQFQNTHQGILNKGFEINTDEQAIVHTGTGKRWSFAGAVKEAAAKPIAEDTGKSWFTDLSQPTPSTLAPITDTGTLWNPPPPDSGSFTPLDTSPMAAAPAATPSRVWRRDPSGKLVLAQ